MIEKIQTLLASVPTLAANDAKSLEALRIQYMGKKGLLNDLMAEFRSVPAEQKREIGQQLNILKTAVQERLQQLREQIAANG